MLEREVEKKLVDGVRRMGGRAYKFVSPGNDGVPDRIVVLPDTAPMFVENGIRKVIQTAEGADYKTGKSWSKRESPVWSEGRRKFFGGDVEWNLNHTRTRHTASKRSWRSTRSDCSWTWGLEKQLQH